MDAWSWDAVDVASLVGALSPWLLAGVLGTLTGSVGLRAGLWLGRAFNLEGLAVVPGAALASPVDDGDAQAPPPCASVSDGSSFLGCELCGAPVPAVSWRGRAKLLAVLLVPGWCAAGSCERCAGAAGAAVWVAGAEFAAVLWVVLGWGALGAAGPGLVLGSSLWFALLLCAAACDARSGVVAMGVALMLVLGALVWSPHVEEIGRIHGAWVLGAVMAFLALCGVAQSRRAYDRGAERACASRPGLMEWADVSTGGGDVFVAVALGAWFGVVDALVALAIGLGLFVWVQRRGVRVGQALPLVPYLAASALLVHCAALATRADRAAGL